MKKTYNFLKYFLILSVIFISGNLFAQSEIISPEKRKNIQRSQTSVDIAPRQDNTDAIIINVPGSYSTIQAAINAANNGDIIAIASGTYSEDITLNKFLQIRGANYNVNPNTGIRGPETIIHPATSDPDPYSITAVTYFYITPGGSGSTIDGITFDGDNPSLTSGVIMNGADVDAVEAIGAYDGLSNIVISNNIFKNINYAAIDLYNDGNGGASTYDNMIINNKFDNIIPNEFGIGVILYNNCYGSVTDNVMTRTRVGVQTGNFYNADIGSNHSISHNTIESFRIGIFHNLAYSNATAFTIDSNTITTLAGAPNNNGMLIASMQSAVAANINDNIISDARAGYNLWNCPTTSTITISGGTITNCNIGVFANNYDGYSTNAATSVYAMTGITVNNCDTAIRIRDNDLNSNSSTVALNINNVTNIVNGTGLGLLIEGSDASVIFNGAVPVDFSTSLSKYIRLATNGSSLPTANIDAQSVHFGGTNGSSLSNAQLFAVEDKIDHKPDWNSVGFVSVKAFNNYITTNSFYPPNTSSGLIQSGIDIATAGDTVNVGTGTFNENVLLNKSVTLKGNGPANTILTPLVSCTGNGITISASNANVNDLRVTDFNYGITTSSSTISLYNVESIVNCLFGINTGNGTNGLTMVKCKFNNNLSGGWRAGTADNVSNVIMDSCEATGNSSAGAGFGTFIAASSSITNTFDNITIKNSDFSNNLKKGMYFEKLSNALIDNVIIDNSGTDAAYGFNNGVDINLKYGAYSNITIQNSTITNCGSTGTAGDVNNPSALAIKARDDAPSYNSNPATLTGFVMKNCFVTGPNNGLRFGEFNKVNNSPTGNTVTENHFGGGYSNKAVLNTTSNNIAVSCNWYGSTSIPTVASLNGTGITFIPFLTDGTDDNPGAAGFQIVAGSCNGLGPVKNVTQNITYITIQSAVNAANNGDLIEVSPGTYNEQVLVNKQVVIKGVGASMPVVDYTGVVSGKTTIFDVSVDNVTLENMRIRVDLTKLHSAIIASGTGIDNITVTGDSIEAYGSSAAGNLGQYGNRNAISINYGGNTNYRVAAGGVDNVNVQGNTVLGVADDGFGQPRFFRAAVSCDEVGGTFSNNNLLSINHDVLVRFGSNGNVDIQNNNIIGGGVEISDMNAGANIITISDNTFDATAANFLSPNAAVLRLKNNYNSKTTNVLRNSFSNHMWGMSLENYNTVTVDSNVFTPISDSTNYHHIAVNTKSISTNSNTIVQVTVGAVLTRNIFNYSGVTGGTALSFHNHDNDNASIGVFDIGTAGNENKFNNGIQNFIYLDPQTGASTGSTFPAYNSLIGVGAGAITTMACWSTDLNIENNEFDVGSGLQLPSAMNFAERSTLETNLFHKPDNACLGNLSYFMPVHNVTQNTYYMTIQSAVTAANPNDSIECAEYTYNERVTVNKTLAIVGVNKTNCVVTGSGLAGTGKGFLITNGVTGVRIQNFTVQNFAGAGGNTDAGIYAIGGNNNLTIRSVVIQNNAGGSGFYMNGPVNTVTIDSVTSSGHLTGARGIVIWNGLKENISITNCEVFNNNCCGIELQDGTASGVTIENNNVHDNADNGIGLVGLQGPGENLVKSNTLLNNGRFGIEIKNPNGSGLTTGPGRVVVENNDVSRTVAIVDNRDIVGIAAFRRGVLAGNVDVPNGAVIQNNTVSGYQQPSVSDGFGIVVEGTNHSVTGNTVNNCDVGIQRQAGHLPAPPLDGDQSNLPDQYFGRGNSAQTCGITISGNIFASNGVDTRDVGPSSGAGIVMNQNTGKVFCSIQPAIDDSLTLNGHVIGIDSGYYNESVIINKEVELAGTGAVPDSRPVVEGVLNQTFSVKAQNVTINNLIVKFDQGSVNTGIKADSSGTFDNLTVKNSCVFGTGTTGVVIFGSYGIQLGTFGGVLYDQVNLDSNEIRHIGTSPLGRGVRTLNCYGDWKNSFVFGYYTIQAGDIQGGILNITDDSLFGTSEINSLGTGTHSFSNNVCNVSNAYGGGTDYALLELKNISNPTANLNVAGNKFENYVNFGVFSGRSNNVTIDNNTFTPDPTAVNFRSIRIDTKQRTLAPQSAFASGAVITKNTFNGNLALNQAAISLEFARSDSISSFDTVIVGGAGNENNFNNNVKQYISLNNEQTATSGDPAWFGTYISIKGKVKLDADATNNNYNVGAGLQLPTAMTLANLFLLEDKIQHKIDDGGLGFVLAKANNDYVTTNSYVLPTVTTPSVQRGIDAASPGFTVNVSSGSFTGQLEVNKDLTIDGQGIDTTNIISPNTLTLSFTTSGVNKPVVYVHDAANVVIKDLTVDGAGKGNANNRFMGIAYRNAGGTVRECEITAIRNSPIDGVQAGIGLFAAADDGNARTLDIIKNVITDFQKNGTSFSGADLTANSDSNTVTGAGPVSFIAQNGIQLGFGAAGSVTNNTINDLSYVPSTFVSTGVLLYQPAGPVTTSKNTLTACQVGIYYIDVGGDINENILNTTAANTGTSSYWGIVADPGGDPRVKSDPFDLLETSSKKQVNILDNSAITTSIYRNVLTSDGTNGVGIEMDAIGTETLNATATENKVNGWDAAVFFYKDAGATLNGMVFYNDLSGGTFTLYDQTGVLQSATCNWLGSTDLPTIMSGISGSVNYAPYLTNGTDSDLVTIGFQPFTTACTGLPASVINIKVLPEGFYYTGTQTLNMRDTVRAYLHASISPFNVLDSAIGVIDSVTFMGSFSFTQPSGTYYIVVKHRNSIETWSKAGGESFVAATVMNYDFTDLVTKAYNSNMAQVDSSPDLFGIYSGDVDQDGSVTLADVINVSNDAASFTSGYVETDVTGNNVTDLEDIVVTNNNSFNFVQIQQP